MSSKLVILWRCQFCKKLSILYYIAGWVPLLLPGRHRVPGEFWPLCNIREGEIAINSDPFPPVVHGARGENTLENATVHNELYQKTLTDFITARMISTSPTSFGVSKFQNSPKNVKKNWKIHLKKSNSNTCTLRNLEGLDLGCHVSHCKLLPQCSSILFNMSWSIF